MLDVDYGEDAARTRERNLARNLAVIWRVAKNLPTAAGQANGDARDQRRFAHSPGFRDTIFPK